MLEIVDESKIEAMVDLTTEVLGEMQLGALSVADKEARGAQLLTQLDISYFRDCLKRSYLDGPGANIAHAQTTVEEARRQNLARQAAGVKNSKELFVKPEPMSIWSSKASVDFVVGEYKEMKQFLLEASGSSHHVSSANCLALPPKRSRLNGMMVNNAHPEFKLGLLTRLCNLHWGELRQFGGVWRLAWGEFKPPAWAKRMKPEGAYSSRPADPSIGHAHMKFQPCIYSFFFWLVAAWVKSRAERPSVSGVNRQLHVQIGCKLGIRNRKDELTK